MLGLSRARFGCRKVRVQSRFDGEASRDILLAGVRGDLGVSSFFLACSSSTPAYCVAPRCSAVSTRVFARVISSVGFGSDAHPPTSAPVNAINRSPVRIRMVNPSLTAS